MPTGIPGDPWRDRRLSLPQTIRFFVLLAKIQILDARLHSLTRQGAGFADDRLLRVARKWLACHEAIGALLPGVLEPEYVAEMRAILHPLAEIRGRAAGPPHPPGRAS